MKLWNKRLPITLSTGLVVGTLLAQSGPLVITAQAADLLQTTTNPATEQAAETQLIVAPAADEWMDPVAISAQLLGMETDALYTELDSGKSIAEVAQAKGVNVQTIVDAIVAADATFIDQLVADGELTAEEAAEWKAESAQYASEFVNDDWSNIVIDDGADPVAIAAPLLGMEPDALYTELEGGKSIAQIAQEKGVDVQTIVDAIVAADATFIDQLVADGEITAEEAAEWKAESVQYATDFVNDDWSDVGDGNFVDYISIVTQSLSLTEQELIESMDAGKTIAQLATEKGVDPQGIINALVAADTEWIDQQVAAGELTAEEAAEWRAESSQFAIDFVNNGWTEDDVVVQ